MTAGLGGPRSYPIFTLELHHWVGRAVLCPPHRTARTECAPYLRAMMQCQTVTGIKHPVALGLWARELKQFCDVGEPTKELLKNAMANLSARAYDRILKVAPTIADLV